MEQWKIIPSSPNYEASNWGNIRNIEKQNILKPWSSLGYLYVRLPINNKYRSIRVQYLIAEAFYGPKPENYNLHHKDFDKTNNHISNLVYLSSIEHRRKHNSYKLNKEDVLTIRALYRGGFNYHQIAKMFPVCDRHIANIVQMVKWKHI